MANSGRNVPKSPKRNAYKSTGPRKTDVANTKDFSDWKAAGSPPTWTPRTPSGPISSHSDYKPSKGPR